MSEGRALAGGGRGRGLGAGALVLPDQLGAPLLLLDEIEFLLYFLFPVQLGSGQFVLNVFSDLLDFSGRGRADFRQFNIMVA